MKGPNNRRPILVTGITGQIGRALKMILRDRCIGLTRSQLDLTQLSQIKNVLHPFDVSAVINAAAYTQVDKAEAEYETAMKVNGHAPGILSRWCASRGIPFVHFSTDYVYSGKGKRPWNEDTPMEPVNAYGRSKSEGDRQVALSRAQWLIFRPAWVYDAKGNNFLTTMLRIGKKNEKIRVVNDQFGAPTYAYQLALATVKGLDTAKNMPLFPSGVYHLCNSGTTTWYEFAVAIFDKAREMGMPLKVNSVKTIPASEYPTPAQRPLNSRLNTDKSKQVLNLDLPDWRTGLSACMKEVVRV